MDKKITVVCVKWGSLYGAEYVNNLYAAVSRNLFVPHDFVCFTDDSRNLSENVIPKPLPQSSAQKWWNKLYIFTKEAGLHGTVLYLDLDIIITGSLDEVVTYAGLDTFCITEDFNRATGRNYPFYNTSVMKWNTEHHRRYVNGWWAEFLREHALFSRRYTGDQEFVSERIRQTLHDTFPSPWFVSYKWELLKKRYRLDRDPVKGVVFHGNPKPHAIDNPALMKHWVA